MYMNPIIYFLYLKLIIFIPKSDKKHFRVLLNDFKVDK